MSAGDPPEVRSVSLTRSAPFIEVEKRHEKRGDHAFMAVMMGVAAVFGIAVSSLPVAFVAVLGFVGGYAFNNWLVFEDLYGGGE
ncbi:hypothetical protein [Halorubrum sp. PV6]|uniref:hypothetical protein n=1 Tax=Halorubrum sp. PV6 TaxID=634157 RepID=UPI000F8D814D|nr:hypothetical protein [Halorubrum sp. PV6]